MVLKGKNVDPATVEGFGDEWARFSQPHEGQHGKDLDAMYEAYFHVFPWDKLPPNPVGMDVGCGSGRWARFVAPKVSLLHCIDASQEALAVAQKNLASYLNLEFHHASVDDMPIPDNSLDFAYSLGVLHHVPNTASAISDCVKKLKPGAPFLLYLYYALENRPAWFQALFQGVNVVRKRVSTLPLPLRNLTADALAVSVYYPLARTAKAVQNLGLNPENLPLTTYRDKSFYMMRTDARDRFGTQLEQRFTRDQIQTMMQSAGLKDIRFYEGMPYWCAVGTKA